MRVLQINSVANSGSTGRIAEEIGNVLLAHGHDSYIAYGRGKATSSSKLIKIGTDKDVYLHGAYTLLTDKHGFGSIRATQKFIQEVEKINVDLIALHNLHGYYIHLPTLLDFINKIAIISNESVFFVLNIRSLLEFERFHIYSSVKIINRFNKLNEKKGHLTIVNIFSLIFHSAF